MCEKAGLTLGRSESRDAEGTQCVCVCVNCREDDLGEIGRYKQCKGLKAMPGIWLLSLDYWRAAKRSWLGEWHAVERS